jgi:hypothetical protein
LATMDNVRTPVIGSTTFITHSILAQALHQVSWTFIVFITLLASQRAPSADKISVDGAPLSRRPSVKGKRGFKVEATLVGIRMEGLSALIVKEDELAANEIVKSRETGWLGLPSPLVRTTVTSIGGEFS